MKRLILLSSIFLLTACQPPQPTVFGVPQSTWNALTPQQQQQIIQGYNQRKMIETQNAPIQSAIDTAGSVLNNPMIMK